MSALLSGGNRDSQPPLNFPGNGNRGGHSGGHSNFASSNRGQHGYGNIDDQRRFHFNRNKRNESEERRKKCNQRSNRNKTRRRREQIEREESLESGTRKCAGEPLQSNSASNQTIWESAGTQRQSSCMAVGGLNQTSLGSAARSQSAWGSAARSQSAWGSAAQSQSVWGSAGQSQTNWGSAAQSQRTWGSAATNQSTWGHPKVNQSLWGQTSTSKPNEDPMDANTVVEFSEESSLIAESPSVEIVVDNISAIENVVPSVDDDASLSTKSVHSSTIVNIDNIKDEVFLNDDYFKHFHHSSVNMDECPPTPEKPKDRYVFPYQVHLDNNYAELDNMSCETENEYVLVKYNTKSLQESVDEEIDADYRQIIADEFHKWNWKCNQSRIRPPLKLRRGQDDFYVRAYSKIGGKSKLFNITGYEVCWNSQLSEGFNDLDCSDIKDTLPYLPGDERRMYRERTRKPFNGTFQIQNIENEDSCLSFVNALRSTKIGDNIYDIKKMVSCGKVLSERLYRNYSSGGGNWHKTLWMPTSCPMGVLDFLCFDNEPADPSDKNAPPPGTFKRISCGVPKGRAVVFSAFYGEVLSSDKWGLSSTYSKRLVAESGNPVITGMEERSLEVFAETLYEYQNRPINELHDYIKSTVPTYRQLLQVFRCFSDGLEDHDVCELNSVYYQVRRTTT